MSDETASAPEPSEASLVESAPKARRTTPRAKKIPKAPAAEKSDSPVSEPVAETAPASIPSPAEESPAAVSQDWPEPEPASSGGGAPSESAGKRKRRRRKGKGGQQNGQTEPAPEDAAIAESGPAEASPQPRPQHAAQQPPQPQPQRPKIDPEFLAKMAWKIYLAEVSEEGVALIGDNDAKDLARRCFRLAEIFIDEQTRRR